MLDKNYFEWFGLPLDFDVEHDRVNQAHQKLMIAFHPDQFVRATEQEQRVAAQVTAHVNEAKVCLLNPIRRAQYCLKLLDVSFDEHRAPPLSPDFLMNQMSWREDIETLRERVVDGRWDQTSQNKIESLSAEVSRYWDEKLLELAGLINPPLALLGSDKATLQEFGEPSLVLIGELQFVDKARRELGAIATLIKDQ